LPPLAEASAIEKAHFAGDAWNCRDAVAGKRDPAAERDIRDFALKLAKEGNCNVIGNGLLGAVDGSHAELNVKEHQDGP